MKYIIDIPDGMTCINALKYEDSKCVAARSYIIPELIPYTEPNEDEIRNKAEDEVWKFAKKIGSFNGLAKRDLDECFGHTTIQGVMTTYDTYREAKREYEKWKKSKEEIRVGDEVTVNDFGDIGVVTYANDSCCCILWSDGIVSEEVRKSELRSTGRHFNITHELLKKMS